MPINNSSTRIQRSCDFCKKIFYALPRNIRLGKGRYCSNACKNNGFKRPMSERFWCHVTKSDGCWEWNNGKTARGYGDINDDNGHRIRSHQASWIIHNGPIPQGLWVLHKCDNPACVNPGHIYLGTPQDNINDMMERKRKPLGSASGVAKLTESDIPVIRRMAKKGIPQKKIAKQYSVSRQTIYCISSRKSWKHVISC